MPNPLLMPKSLEISRSGLGRRDFLKACMIPGLVGLTTPTTAWGSTRNAYLESMLSARPEVESKINAREYGQKRIRRIQEAIRKNGFDAFVISSFHKDYTGYVVNYHPSPTLMAPGVALVPAEGSPTIWVRTYWAHEKRVREALWIEDFHNLPGDEISENDFSQCYEACVEKIKSLKLTRGRVGLVGDEIDWLLRYYFQDRLPSLRVENANPILDALRIIKDEEELGLLRRAQQILDEVAYPRLQELLVPGARDYDIYAEVVGSMVKSGADSMSLLILGIGPPNLGAWTYPPHGRRIEKGDTILIEPIPFVGHYNVEKMFTFAVGNDMPETQKRAAQVIYDSFLIALDSMKPGVEFRPVLEKCTRFIKSKGYEGTTVLIGHWIGMENHEGPRITPKGTRGLILQPGMAISWHPNLVIPGARTCCSACLLITDKGVESMSKVPMQPMYYV